jgi:hypothetical protein
VRTPGKWDELSELAADLGVRNHIILNACLLLAEGPTEAYLLPRFFVQVTGYQLAAIGVELLRQDSSDKGGYDPAWQLCRHALRNNRKAFLLLDRDTRTHKRITPDMVSSLNESVNRECLSENRNLAFAGTRELEDDFSDEVLSIALQEYSESCAERATHDLTPPTEDEALKIVEEARRLSEVGEVGMTKTIGSHLNCDHHINLGKPRFAENIFEVSQRQNPDFIPPSLEDCFEKLQEYAAAPFSDSQPEH